MATNLQLANRALLELGQVRTLTQSDLDNPSDAASETVAEAMPQAIKDVVSSHDFPDARGLKELSPLSAASNLEEFKFAYPIPSDVSVLRSVLDGDFCPVVDYRLENFSNAVYVLTDRDPVIIHYTRRIDDISVLSDYLFAPLVFWLASIIAKPLTGEMNERDRLSGFYRDTIRRAKTEASRTNPPQYVPGSSGYHAAFRGHGHSGSPFDYPHGLHPYHHH